MWLLQISTMLWQDVLFMLMFLEIEACSVIASELNRMLVLGSIYAESAVLLPVWGLVPRSSRYNPKYKITRTALAFAVS